MAKSTYQTTKILDLDVFSSKYSQLLHLLETHILEQKSLLTVMTPNPEQVVLSRKNKSFLHQLRSADILIPDGIGLVLASQLLASGDKNPPILERITGKDVALELLSRVVQHQWSVLVIGGRGYGADALATEGQLPKVNNLDLGHHVYWTQGYATVSQPTDEEEKALRALIKEKKPTIVFVAFGAPHQEAWLVEHRSQLETAGVRLAMVVGGAFDVLLGKVLAAPLWMQQLGLEWLFRLFQEPWRLKRQLQLFVFLKIVIQEWRSLKS